MEDGNLFPVDDDFELPSAREVNKRLRAEAKAAKQALKKSQTGEGLLSGALRRAQRDHAGDPKRQLAETLASRSIPAAIGRRRTISDKRFRDLQSYMHRFLTLLPRARAPIRNLGDFGRPHFLALVRYWQRKGLGDATARQYYSVMRRFCCLVGKPDVVPCNDEFKELLASHGLVLGVAPRQYVPDFPLAWQALGVEPAEIIERTRADGREVVASLMEMQWRFGLRDNEAIHLRPHQADAGNCLVVVDGTKGGKPRTVRYFKDPEKARAQREALERAKELASKHPQRRLATKGRTMDQMYGHFLKTVAKYGVTQKGLGVTLHGLRHQFGVDMFQDISGMPAPVLGLLPADEYKRNAEKVRAALQDVSLQMGHERSEITGAYVGSATKLGKDQRRRIEHLLGQLEVAQRTIVQAGVKEAWMTGAAGRGSAMHQTEPLGLAVRLHDDCAGLTFGEVAARLDSLRQAASQATGRSVVVTPWTQSGMPDDATEIVFAYAVQRGRVNPDQAGDLS